MYHKLRRRQQQDYIHIIQINRQTNRRTDRHIDQKTLSHIQHIGTDKVGEKETITYKENKKAASATTFISILVVYFGYKNRNKCCFLGAVVATELLLFSLLFHAVFLH